MLHNKVPGNYDDILHLPRPVSAAHPPMPQQDRAAQFAPFAALTGYDAAVQKAAHRNEQAAEAHSIPLEESLRALDKQLRTGQRPTAVIDCLCTDSDTGGTWLRITAVVEKLDTDARILVLTDGTVLSLSQIRGLRLDNHA